MKKLAQIRFFFQAKFWLFPFFLLLLWIGLPHFSAAAPPAGTGPSNPTVAADPNPAQGPPAGGSLWRDVNETAFRGPSNRQIIPHQYRLVEVDLAALDQLLAQSPLEDSLAAQNVSTVLTLPLPDGSLGRFQIEESPVMAPDLAAQLPEVKTYRGVGLDDPTATARLDRTPAGFHAMILSATGTVYIDPYGQGDFLHYISYDKTEYNNIWGKVRQEGPPMSSGAPKAQSLSGNAVSANIRRTYRLAVAATGEYTQFYGGTVAGAQAGIVTTINRVTGIYERELLVRLQLINNTGIIYTNPATDPYTNDDGGAMLSQNQATLNAVIGSSNYDVGHVFSTGGGGVASLGVICNNSFKGRGVTGSFNPVGDPFDVDFVAHELGHQFGGSHPFNAGNAGSCDSGNRNGPTAYEPGSGSTIMAYAGICPPQDLQLNSDDYFHGINFDEIMAHITDTSFFGGDKCSFKTTISNAAPVVSAGPNYTIPRQTPFSLTGSASDADGDNLTYSWEEFDLGLAANGGLPNTDADAVRPIFRSYPPASTGIIRMFPALTSILDGTNQNSGESLPARDRTMHFRLTARDNKGGVTNASTAVTVAGAAGPFAVTLPNTAVTWTGLTQETVTWDVANTNIAPVSCDTVNLRLSTDGGNTFPASLATNTPNDGSQTIVVPANSGTTTARIKVACANNIFFDISNADFTITNVPGPNLAITKTVTLGGASIEAGTPVTYTITIANSGTQAANSVHITDPLPSELSGSSLDTTVNIPAGQNQTFILAVTVNQGVSPDARIINTAYFSHSSGNDQSSVVLGGSSNVYLPIVVK